MRDNYWDLVDSDPRPWSRDQKILFWWVALLLHKVVQGGIIAAPDPAPLKDDEVVQVFNELLPKEGTNERSYLDVIWVYKNQTVIIPTSEGNMATIKSGKIEVNFLLNLAL